MNSKKSQPFKTVKAHSYSIYLQNATRDELDKLIETTAMEGHIKGIEMKLVAAIARELGRRRMLEDIRDEIQRMSQKLHELSIKAGAVMS